MMDNPALIHATKLRECLSKGQGYVVQGEVYSIIFFPGVAIQGWASQRSLVISEPNFGCYVLEEPERVNHYTLVRAGMTLPASNMASKIVKCLISIIQDDHQRHESGDLVPQLQSS